MAFSKFATAATEARSSSRAVQIGSLSCGLIELLRVKKLYDGAWKRVNVVRAWVALIVGFSHGAVATIREGFVLLCRRPN